MYKLWLLFTAVTLFVLAPSLVEHAKACTVISAGTKATDDGSVMTSHTCDSHRTASDIQVVPPKDHPEGAMLKMTKRKEVDSTPMQTYGREPVGEIPQVAHTFGYLAPAYASMNQYQLAIGESTFDGVEKLKSDKGLIDCESLTRLILERAKTAKEGIEVAGELLAKYGWNDVGEVLTLADPTEVWHLEIIGPGEGKVGAVWVAKRIPDGHVSVVANASRITEIEKDTPETFLYSDNVFQVAIDHGLWDPKGDKPFYFCDVYHPGGRQKFSSTRREWRVLSYFAPSLELDPNSNYYPFSVKPDEPVTAARIMEIFRDTFEGTDFDMTKNITYVDEDGKAKKSPLANPFMPYDMNQLFKINGGWGWRGERTLARWYTMYATVTVSRSWLPDPVGGLVWFGYDNTAMTTYAPLYVGVMDLPDDYETDGRLTGFSKKSAWWAFNRVASLSAQRWGDMKKDVAAVYGPLQKALFEQVADMDEEAKALYDQDPAKAAEALTAFTAAKCKEVTDAYWDLGDILWTKYDEKW